ncbi:LysR substrate-binding domain-containing protein [Phenylobacterium sp. LjRoot225]|uniref:LysR substrate-binding domain-containing protein n=1 Tax=Phenylobacterium sp. LjRoot225 TaxID=3342285 RepID=UPI003ED06CD5
MRRPLPSLTGLRAFEAFARAGSMTGAAAELNITHGAVSRQVRALETRLGARLVVGPRHDLRLTDAGRRLAAALGMAFDQIRAALPGAEAEHELVVSCLGTLAMKWLIPRLPAFLDRHPALRLRIIESHAPADFSQGGIHAAIRILGERPPEGVAAVPFMDHHHGPVLSPERWRACNGALAEVLKLPRLHSETFRPAWSEWARHAGVDLPPSVEDREFEHNSYMLVAATAGLGAAVAPWAFAAPDIEAGRLVAPFGFRRFDARYVLLHPARTQNGAVQALADWLREAGAQTPLPPPPLAVT